MGRKELSPSRDTFNPKTIMKNGIEQKEGRPETLPRPGIIELVNNVPGLPHPDLVINDFLLTQRRISLLAKQVELWTSRENKSRRYWLQNEAGQIEAAKIIQTVETTVEKIITGQNNPEVQALLEKLRRQTGLKKQEHILQSISTEKESIIDTAVGFLALNAHLEKEGIPPAYIHTEKSGTKRYGLEKSYFLEKALRIGINSALKKYPFLKEEILRIVQQEGQASAEVIKFMLCDEKSPNEGKAEWAILGSLKSLVSADELVTDVLEGTTVYAVNTKKKTLPEDPNSQKGEPENSEGQDDAGKKQEKTDKDNRIKEKRERLQTAGLSGGLVHLLDQLTRNTGIDYLDPLVLKGIIEKEEEIKSLSPEHYEDIERVVNKILSEKK